MWYMPLYIIRIANSSRRYIYMLISPIGNYAKSKGLAIGTRNAWRMGSPAELVRITASVSHERHVKRMLIYNTSMSLCCQIEIGWRSERLHRYKITRFIVDGLFDRWMYRIILSVRSIYVPCIFITGAASEQTLNSRGVYHDRPETL